MVCHVEERGDGLRSGLDEIRCKTFRTKMIWYQAAVPYIISSFGLCSTDQAGKGMPSSCVPYLKTIISFPYLPKNCTSLMWTNSGFEIKKDIKKKNAKIVQMFETRIMSLAVVLRVVDKPSSLSFPISEAAALRQTPALYKKIIILKTS